MGINGDSHWPYKLFTGEITDEILFNGNLTYSLVRRLNATCTFLASTEDVEYAAWSHRYIGRLSEAVPSRSIPSDGVTEVPGAA